MMVKHKKEYEGRDETPIKIIAIIRGESRTSYRVCKDLREAQDRRGGGRWIAKRHVQRGAYLLDEGRFDKRQYLTLPKRLVDRHGFAPADAS